MRETTKKDLGIICIFFHTNNTQVKQEQSQNK